MFKIMLHVYINNYTPNELLGSLASFLLWQRRIFFSPMAEKFYKNTVFKCLKIKNTTSL